MHLQCWVTLGGFGFRLLGLLPALTFMYLCPQLMGRTQIPHKPSLLDVHFISCQPPEAIENLGLPAELVPDARPIR
jgi:hypothetical protein